MVSSDEGIASDSNRFLERNVADAMDDDAAGSVGRTWAASTASRESAKLSSNEAVSSDVEIASDRVGNTGLPADSVTA